MLGDKKVLYSGMQSTGNLTLGNYLGALKNWITLSDEYECFYSVANMHSITVRQNPTELRKHARELLTLFIAVLGQRRSVVAFRRRAAAGEHAQTEHGE